jgi:tripartite-type tricarboxylate transporter receptor subunit TctC
VENNRREEDIMSKRMLSTSALVFVCFFAGGSIFAQEKYPERPIQMVVPVAAGSYNDVGARVLADSMPKYLGQPVIPLNKPGARGFIAGAYVASSKPDGYTLFACGLSPTNPEIYEGLSKTTYTSKDIARIANFSAFVVMFCVRGDAPWKSVKELLEYAKSNPDKLKWGHSGVGGSYWLMGVLLEKEAGVKMQDIPFNGDGETMTALLGNHIDMGVLTYGGAVIQQIEANKIRPLCLFHNTRLDELPGVPIIKELGFQHTTLEFMHFGVFAPKGTPENIISKLDETIVKVTKDAEFNEKMKKLHMPIIYMDRKSLMDFETREAAKLRKMLKEAGYL